MYNRFLYGRFSLLKIPTLGRISILFSDKSLTLKQINRYSSTNDRNVADYGLKLDLQTESPKKAQDTDELSTKTANSYLNRYSVSTVSDSFFVDRSRLTFGESFYQKFSSGTTKREFSSNLKLPVLTNYKSLLNLLDSKVPVLIFYYKKEENIQNSLLLNLNRVLLSEISKILSADLKVVFVDINAFKEQINPSAKAELFKFDGFLYHLLVPYGSEPLIATLSPLVTVESFVDEIQKILGQFKLNSAHKPLEPIFRKLGLISANLGSNTDSVESGLTESVFELDKKLSLLRNCLFELELNNKKFDSLLAEESLDCMLNQCKRVK